MVHGFYVVTFCFQFQVYYRAVFLRRDIVVFMYVPNTMIRIYCKVRRNILIEVHALSTIYISLLCRNDAPLGHYPVPRCLSEI